MLEVVRELYMFSNHFSIFDVKKHANPWSQEVGCVGSVMMMGGGGACVGVNGGWSQEVMRRLVARGTEVGGRRWRLAGLLWCWCVFICCFSSSSSSYLFFWKMLGF